MKSADGLYELQVWGGKRPRIAPEFVVDGKTYVVGDPGPDNAFDLLLHNGGDQPVLAIVRVEGANVLNRGDTEPRGRGFLLLPQVHIYTGGWRWHALASAHMEFEPLTPDHIQRLGEEAGRLNADFYLGQPIDEHICPTCSRRASDRVFAADRGQMVYGSGFVHVTEDSNRKILAMLDSRYRGSPVASLAIHYDSGYNLRSRVGSLPVDTGSFLSPAVN